MCWLKRDILLVGKRLKANIRARGGHLRAGCETGGSAVGGAASERGEHGAAHACCPSPMLSWRAACCLTFELGDLCCVRVSLIRWSESVSLARKKRIVLPVAWGRLYLRVAVERGRTCARLEREGWRWGTASSGHAPTNKRRVTGSCAARPVLRRAWSARQRRRLHPHPCSRRRCTRPAHPPQSPRRRSVVRR
jgi:hypothetical protein